MNALTIAALAKAFTDQAKIGRESLRVGKGQTVDETVTVRVTASVTVGEDYTQKIVAKADPWLLLSVALSHLNGKTIDSIVKEAVNHDPAMLAATKEKAAEAIAKMVASTETACKGAVKVTKVNLEVLS
jgi:hypothetical protein